MRGVVAACTLAAETAAGLQTQAPDPWQAARARMVESQIEARDVRAPAVLSAMRQVPRHLSVPSDVRESAYEDRPLPIGLG